MFKSSFARNQTLLFHCKFDRYVLTSTNRLIDLLHVYFIYEMLLSVCWVTITALARAVLLLGNCLLHETVPVL
jgi:hypothetical protein